MQNTVPLFFGGYLESAQCCLWNGVGEVGTKVKLCDRHGLFHMLWYKMSGVSREILPEGY